MNLPMQILLQIALVGGGIFVYDAVKSPDRAPESADYQDYDSTGGHSSDAEPQAEEMLTSPSATLDGSRSLAMISKNAAQLKELQRQIAVLTRNGPESTDGGGDEPLASDMGSLPAPGGTADEPTFDDKSLARFSAYMKEAQRREREQRRRDSIMRTLDAEDLQLSSGQKDAIVSLALEHQDKMRDVMREASKIRSEDGGREKRRELFDTARKEFNEQVAELVPTATAEKISNSRLTRMFGGFMGGNRGRGRRGR